MIKQIPLKSLPNQRVFFVLNERPYSIEITTRIDRLYISIWINEELVLSNRALLSFAPIEYGFKLVDTEATDDPNWEQLGTRFLLLVNDEI